MSENLSTNTAGRVGGDSENPFYPHNPSRRIETRTVPENHNAFLNLGSNIEAEIYVPRAVELLRETGRVEAVSTAWESLAVGTDGANFLNACVLFVTPLSADELKEEILRPIEDTLGRTRGLDKFAPRKIDIDIVLFDETVYKPDNWEHAFVVVPLAEIIPEFMHPAHGKILAHVAAEMQESTWLVARSEVLKFWKE